MTVTRQQIKQKANNCSCTVFFFLNIHFFLKNHYWLCPFSKPRKTIKQGNTLKTRKINEAKSKHAQFKSVSVFEQKSEFSSSFAGTS